MSAQATVHSASVAVEMDPAGDARVDITYRLEGAGPGEEIPLRALGFGGPLSVGGEDVRMALAQGKLWTALVAPELESDGSVRLRLVYTVERAAAPRAGAVRATIPLVTVDRPPEDPRPGLFSADLRVPDGWAVTEGFPTGLRPAEVAGHHRVELQVVPSMLAFRGRTDGSAMPGLPELLDAVAILLLVSFSWVGWRHMSRETA